MTLDEEITLLENADTSLIVNMFAEKMVIYRDNNKITANKLFEPVYIKYVEERYKNGPRRLELYGLRKVQNGK